MSHLRKIFTLCFLISLSLTVNSQVVFSEGFENGGAQPAGWTISNTSGNPAHNWGITNYLSTNGIYSDSAEVFNGDTLILTSPFFSTVNKAFVVLEFDHICDISGFDTARIEVRRSPADPWINITRQIYYEGPPEDGELGPLWNGGASRGFNEFSYPGVWGILNLGLPQWIDTLHPQWFRTETFNVSNFIDSAAQAQVRFKLEGSPGIPASGDFTAWFLDSVRVIADSCETIKPLGNFLPPFIPNNSIQNTLGPFKLKATFTDKHSGIDTAYIRYMVNGGPLLSVGMYKTGPNDWEGLIPKLYNSVDTFKYGDSVCYYLQAYDKSNPCHNFVRLPNPLTGDTCFKFHLKQGVALPYCENYEVNNLWTDSVTPVPAIWEKGTPSFGAHSGTKAWATRLTGNYPDNITGAYLYSPIFDFGSAITPRLTFWMNRQMPTDNDKVSLEYSINRGAWTRLGVKNDPNGVRLNAPFCPSTWYTGSGAFGWNGNSGGWVEVFYQMPSAFTAAGGVQFRFKIESDGGGNGYGVAIDDFCIQNPPKIDVSGIQLIAPGDYTVNHRHFIREAGALDSVVAIIRNTGTDTLFSVSAQYTIMPATSAPVTVNETFSYPRPGSTRNHLAPLQSDTIKFVTKYVVPKNAYQVRFRPTVTGDADITNDTVITKGHFGFIVTPITHLATFDGTDTLWSTTPFPVGTCGNPPVIGGTRWEKGTPNWGVTNSAFSSPNSWDINLTAVYTANQTEYLYTQFYDLSNWDQAFVSFWQNRNTTPAQDGFRLEYNINPVTPTWRELRAAAPNPKEINWYTGAALAAGLGNGWSGNSNGWIYSEFPINLLTGVNAIPTGPAGSRVQFRFVFRSDATSSTLDDGISIDNFRIVNPPLEDLEFVKFIRPPKRGCVMDIREPVEIQVKNVGKVPLDTGFFCYEYTPLGPGIVCDTVEFNPPLAAGAYAEHTMVNDSADLSQFNTYTFTGWTGHPRDTNKVNDTILNPYEVENVEGCVVNVTFTTGPTIPLGAKLYMIDTTSLPHDTIYELPMSAVGPNQVEYTFDVCMSNVLDAKFVITPNAPDYISYWNLQDYFADTSVGTGTGPTGPSGYGFHWECPPLLSASSEGILLNGLAAKLPIPQDYEVSGVLRNRGSVRLRKVEFTLDIVKMYPGVPFTPVLNQTDTLYFHPIGIPILARISPPHQFSSIWHASPGQYKLCIWTSNPNGNPDLATYDDTVCLDWVILDTIRTLPYCNNFDGVVQNPWASLSKNIYDTNSIWQWGTPSQTALNAAASPTKAWMTNLTANYDVLDSSSLNSPLFRVTDTSACYTISFKHKYRTEYAFDGGVVEYSIDSGLTWHIVGEIDDSTWEYLGSINNWYNTPYLVGLEGLPAPPGWTGNSGNAYVNSHYQLKFPDFGKPAFNVVFRFRFGSDGSINNEGWVIDDFCFERLGNCIYEACDDGVLNQDEVDIDCGGICPPCESCFDGILNQNETDVDCGGVCAPCPSCVDGIQNGLETNIDCGGPLCEPCGTCNDGIRNYQWVWDSTLTPPAKVKLWEDPEGDCGGPCPPCWVGIDELNENQFGLGQNIPNPTNGHTTIRYSVPNGGIVNVTIQNMLGQSIYRTTLQASPGINQLEIDVNEWADGVYYYSFEYKGERLIKKLTVNK